jgi:hypothetical protein
VTGGDALQASTAAPFDEMAKQLHHETIGQKNTRQSDGHFLKS